MFANRCPVALQVCHDEKPPLEFIGEGRWVKCHRWREIADGTLTLDTEPLHAETSAPPGDSLTLDVQRSRPGDGEVDREVQLESLGERADWRQIGFTADPPAYAEPFEDRGR